MISAKAKAIVNIIMGSPDPMTNFTLNGGNLRQGLVGVSKLFRCDFQIFEVASQQCKSSILLEVEAAFAPATYDVSRRPSRSHF